MTDHPTDESLQKTAGIAGFLYLMYLVTQIVGDVFIRRQFIVPGDAAATAGTIMAHEWLFRVGFISDIVAALLFLLAAWALYVVLRPVHNNLALAFLLLNLGGVVIQCVNALNLVVAQLLLGNSRLFIRIQSRPVAGSCDGVHRPAPGWIYGRTDILRGLAPSSWLAGIQVGFSSQDPGHTADDRLFQLPALVFPVFPLPGL